MIMHFAKRGTVLHLLLAAAVLLAIALAVFLTAITRATDISWSGSSDPTLTYETKTPPSLSDPHIFGCTAQKIAVDGFFPSIDACVTTGKSIKLATYRNPTNGSDNLAISYLSDTKFYKLSNANVSYSFNPVLMPGTDILYVMMPNGSLARSLSVYKPFPSKLTRTLSIIDHTEYMWDLDAPDLELKDEHGTKWNLGAAAHAPGGRWIVTEVRGGGLIRVDTDNLSAEVISRYYQSYGVGNDPIMSIAVTADGQHVAVGGRNARFVAIDVPDSCGDPATNATMNPDHTMPHPCPEKDYSVFVDSRAGFPNQFNWADNLEFSDDGGQLMFYYGTATERRFVTMTAAGYVPSPPLDYLALGDSYSSGEGDLGQKPDGTSYYTPVTDYQGGCHLSERSYPYKLQAQYNLSSEKMKSVACSGAETKDMRMADVTYSGQGDRLKQLTEQDRKDRQAHALDVFNPGYIEQIRFVKQYKPRAITLTAGGNDINFAGKLIKCASDHEPSVCEYVTNQEWRAQHGYEIKNEFFKLKSLYQELRRVSPDTKIYVIGYPSFINPDTWRPCGYDAADLNGDERVFIEESLKYLNLTIEAAARATGVKYIDITDSLSGGRTCDIGGEYVTGIHDVFLHDLLNFTPFKPDPYSFHPNELGHQKIAEAIENRLGNQSLLSYSYDSTLDDSITAPDPTPYFVGAMTAYRGVYAKYVALTEDGKVIKEAPTPVEAGQNSYEGGSTIIVTTFSDPITLEPLLANADGSLKGQITIPSTVPAGFHTLVFSGKTYSGEPIKYYQTILVEGSDPNDRDEDGIDDTHDSCMFIQEANVDADADGIDDACDPVIGSPVPYRIRSGRVANGEQADYLYIERNVNATTLTGISGDYDPDHDGWAIVAASQNTAQAGPYARFWIDGNDGSKVPHVSLRTAENGCVQYKPANLAKVVDGSVRALAQEAADTNTCRSELATADLDNNGQPDNTQPLYQARNGIAANGEDSRKLYLERSTRGAEVQLGKSDYAGNTTPSTGPTDTVDHRKPWSLLATSNPGLIVDTYKKIKFINNQPYVLAVNFLNQCYAYKSQSLATIKQSTQATRQLQLDWIQTLAQQLQGGCN